MQNCGEAFQLGSKGGGADGMGLAQRLGSCLSAQAVVMKQTCGLEAGSRLEALYCSGPFAHR